MGVPIIVGVVVGLVAAATGWFRAVSGANRWAMGNLDGGVYKLWPTTIAFGVLWGGVAFGVALLITRVT